MTGNASRALALGIFIAVGMLAPSVPARASGKKSRVAANNSSVSGARVQDLTPFTHTADIPADSDLTSIRFESAKTVQVPTKVRSTTDTDYCAELAFRDPGGSRNCPGKEYESFATAFQVTYSYSGPPLVSDEFGNSNFTFQVFFQPEELDPQARKAILERKLSREEVGSYFVVKTLRESFVRFVVDEARSSICEKKPKDGLWVPVDSNCHDALQYKVVAVPSDYVTIRVDPVPPR